ncbi:hypothetical protein NDU88_000577 [Pleurodeles waltl]|uniref:Uncharacterized protein n=1 Tax=Pleurodeles waltl TaxID=8319 RepID=A0AAV7US95_PLEWA|nr:hypothetical protein NDU88_000577 [Pleurodeles waltl]
MEDWGGAGLFSSSRVSLVAPAPAAASLAFFKFSEKARVTALPGSRDTFPGALLVLTLPEGESLPNLFSPGGAPVRHIPSAGVSRRAARPISDAGGSPRMLRPSGTFGRSLRASATPPCGKENSLYITKIELNDDFYLTDESDEFVIMDLKYYQVEAKKKIIIDTTL